MGNTSGDTWGATLPFFGGLPLNIIQLVIVYGILLGVPAVPDMVKKAVGAPDFGAIGQEGIKGFGLGQTVGQAFVNRAVKTPLQERSAVSQEMLKQRTSSWVSDGRVKKGPGAPWYVRLGNKQTP